MKKNLFTIIALLVLLAAAGYWTWRENFWSAGTAFAVGDLTIDWGVPSGDPMFTISSIFPGDMVSKNVVITNNAPTSRPVGIRGIQTSGNGLSGALDLTVSASGTDLYGGTSGGGTKTVAQFFIDSAGVSGIPLLTLAPGETSSLTFNVTFQETAGNELQGDSVTFDITIGIAIDLPASCEGIEFVDDPIFGTARSERLNGTPGNDLIVAFEGGDTLQGQGGDDCLMGGPGNDKLLGGDGHDFLSGEAGSDSLQGGDGQDTLLGGENSDSLQGGDGHDTLEGGPGSDGMRGGDGDDTLTGGEGSDSARGGAGTDTCDAESEAQCEI